MHQRSALLQHSSYKPILSVVMRHRRELPQNELSLFLFRVIAGVVPEAPAQADNGWQTHLVHNLFDYLRRPSQHDRSASRPSPTPVIFV